MYESFGEIQKGNPEAVYTEIYQESLKTILEFSDLASVQYILQEILPELLTEDFTDKDKIKKITLDIIKK